MPDDPVASGFLFGSVDARPAGNASSPEAAPRRRRSLDTYGGISVAEVMRQHTTVRPAVRPRPASPFPPTSTEAGRARQVDPVRRVVRHSPSTEPEPPHHAPAQPPVAGRPWRNEPTEIIKALPHDAGSETDETPKTRLQEKRIRRQHRTVFTAKATTATLAILVFLATGGAWGTKTWYDSKFEQVAALDEDSAHIQNAPAQLGDENFLLVGSDTRAGSNSGDGIGNEYSIPGARSDTLMIAHVPKDRKRAVVVSFPRDLEVARPDCHRWDAKTGEYSDEVVPGADIEKLTLVYSVGGPKCVLKLVQKLSGMKMNHFVGIDFSGFKGMVDAIGGVELTVDERIVDSVLGEIVPEPGEIRFDGSEALSFVRARHVAGDPTSDYGRIKRQQQFISALLSKTMSREVVFDPAKLTRFVNAFAAATFGDNIGVDQLLTLAQSMKGLSTSSITFLTVPTVGYANERGNEVLLADQTNELFQALINNGPLPGEEPETSPSAQADGARTGAPPG